MKCFGSATSFISVLCTYGYSFTIFLPIVVVCAIPIDLMQWILIAYAVFSSTSFILVNYWKELSKYMHKRRYIVLAFILACQIGLFLVLKLYFFQRFTEEMGIKIDGNKDNNITNSTDKMLR
jgi:protein YIPF1/2